MHIDATFQVTGLNAMLSIDPPFRFPRRLYFLETYWKAVVKPNLMLVGPKHDVTGQIQKCRSCSFDQAKEEAKLLLRQAGHRVGFSVAPYPRIALAGKHYREPYPHFRKTLILWCLRVNGAEKFYSNLEKLGITLTHAIPYLTVYTHEDSRSHDGVELYTPLEVMRHTQELIPQALPPLLLESRPDLG